MTESLINGGMEGWTMEKLVPDGLEAIRGFPKMVGLPNKPMGFTTKNYHFGVEIGGTTI